MTTNTPAAPPAMAQGEAHHSTYSRPWCTSRLWWNTGVHVGKSLSSRISLMSTCAGGPRKRPVSDAIPLGGISSSHSPPAQHGHASVALAYSDVSQPHKGLPQLAHMSHRDPSDSQSACRGSSSARPGRTCNNPSMQMTRATLASGGAPYSQGRT